MNKWHVLAATTCWWGLTAGPAWPEDATPSSPPSAELTESGSADTDDDVPDPVKDAARAKELATQFSVTEQQVLDMRQTSKMGWGEIRNLLRIAQAVSEKSAGDTTPLTMDQALVKVLEQRASGMGLGEIAGSYNLKLGGLNKPEGKGVKERADRPGAVGRPEKPERPDKPAKPERPDKPSKPDKPDKPDKPEKPERPDHSGRGR